MRDLSNYCSASSQGGVPSDTSSGSNPNHGAELSPIRKYYRLTAGLGVLQQGLGEGVVFSLQYDALVFSVGFLGSSESPSDGYGFGSGGGGSASAGVSEVDVLYGRGAVFGALYASISAGISYNTYAAAAAWQGSSSLGFPIQAQLMFETSSVFGLGLTIVGNLNPTQSYGGFLFCLQVGDF
jgi:hypothetical protein